MKLSVLTASVSRNAGGLFTSVRKLTQAVEKLGVVCSVSAIEDEHTAEDLTEWAPLVIRTYSRLGPGFFPISQSMLNAVVESEPDIQHAHGIWQYPSIIDLAAKNKSKVPYVISPRGMLDPWALRNSAWKKKLAGWLFENRHLRGAACIHALCESEAESIRAYGLKNPIAVIPNGIDLPQGTEPMQPSPLQRAWEGCKVLLFLGRVHPKKGLVPLIQAWDKLSQDRRDWKLAIAGPDENGHRAEVEALIGKFDLSDSVRVVGPKYRLEKRAWLQHADAYVLPSFSEGFPMAVLEAMAYKLPVLMTPQCNFPEAFAVEAAICSEPTSDQLADGLKKLFTMSAQNRREMAERGYELVKAHYTWPIVAGQMISVYRWLLGRGERPECVREG